MDTSICGDSSCKKYEGFEGYNDLVELIRPFRDLRGFYFGLRSALYHLARPRTETDSSYTVLREVEIKHEGNEVTVEYKPFKSQHFPIILYKANTANALLDPIKNPRPDGDNELGGYFDRKKFCHLYFVFKDVIDFLESGGSEPDSRRLTCPEEDSSVLHFDRDQTPEGLVLSYKFFISDDSGKETLSEEISFIQKRVKRSKPSPLFPVKKEGEV